jgi:hypothetical protein
MKKPIYQNNFYFQVDGSILIFIDRDFLWEKHLVTSCKHIIFVSMKKNANKYQTVDKLPANAVTVKEYADSKEISTSYIYKQIRENKAAFKIVVFQTINFVIPTK